MFHCTCVIEEESGSQVDETTGEGDGEGVGVDEEAAGVHTEYNQDDYYYYDEHGNVYVVFYIWRVTILWTPRSSGSQHQPVTLEE